MSNDDVLQKAREYRLYAQKISNAHYDMAERAKTRHKQFGIPVTALATIVGTAIFANLSAPTQNLWVQIPAGLLSLTAAVLSGLHTFLNYSEAAAQHKTAAADYEGVQHKLDIFLLAHSECTAPEQRNVAIKELQEIGEWLDDISGRSPTIPDAVYDASHPITSKPTIRLPGPATKAP